MASSVLSGVSSYFLSSFLSLTWLEALSVCFSPSEDDVQPFRLTVYGDSCNKTVFIKFDWLTNLQPFHDMYLSKSKLQTVVLKYNVH